MCVLEKVPDGDGGPHWPGTAARFVFHQAFAVDTLPDPQGLLCPAKQALLGQLRAQLHRFPHRKSERQNVACCSPDTEPQAKPGLQKGSR